MDQKAVPVYQRPFVLRTKLIPGPCSGTWDKVDSWTRKLCLFAGDRWYLGQSWFLDLVVVLRTKSFLDQEAVPVLRKPLIHKTELILGSCPCSQGASD